MEKQGLPPNVALVGMAPTEFYSWAWDPYLAQKSRIYPSTDWDFILTVSVHARTLVNTSK